MYDDIDPKIISHLQQMAHENKSIAEMLEYLIEKLNLDKDSRFIVFVYFRRAFKDVGISEMKQIGAWNFFEGGTWDIEKIEEVIGPLIHRR